MAKHQAQSLLRAWLVVALSATLVTRSWSLSLPKTSPPRFTIYMCVCVCVCVCVSRKRERERERERDTYTNMIPRRQTDAEHGQTDAEHDAVPQSASF